jgi:molybdopterin-guanine dinucleotide biosynthesis protein A
MKVAGIVLCGGRSSRMGRPKAWLPFGGEFMLQRVARVLREVVDPIVVVAAPGQDVPELPPEVRIVRDEVEGKGPLGGLAAGLAALEGRADAAYLSSCDVPFLKPGFVARVIDALFSPSPLAGEDSERSERVRGQGEGDDEAGPSPGGEAPPSPARGEGYSVAVPRVGGYFHPLAAAYRISVLPRVRELLAADRLRPVFLFDAVTTHVIGPGELADVDPRFDSLRNLNTPEEYEEALRELGGPPS